MSFVPPSRHATAPAQRVLEQAQIFDATLANLPDLAYAFDREARVVYANKTLLEVWGRTFPEAVGKTVFELGYPQELAELIHGQLLQVVDTGLPVRGETVFRSASGGQEIHDYIFNPIFDDDGAVAGVAGTSRIVTHARAEQRAARQLAAIVESSDDAIVSKDLNGTIRTWNEGARRLFGYTAEEAVGRSITILIPEDRRDEETRIISRIAAGQRVEHFETVRRRKDGSEVSVSLTVSPILDAESRVIGASKIARDITDQMAAAAALREAKEAAEAANRSKDRFLAVLSHELRTPLTPALMAASALEKDPKIAPELRQDMQIIRRGIELETKLIDDLLDISRITAGKLKLQFQPVDLNEAVAEVCRTCEESAQEKGVRMRRELDPRGGAVRADSARLQQMLWNVLKNAVKFTPAGGEIVVGTRRLDGGGMRVAVRDSGAGIDPAVLPRIFDAFEQGGELVTRQFGGMGLGLAITKGLVELHGGTIAAESAGEGTGSTFTIELPGSSKRDAEAQADAGAGARRCARILLVEDHADTREALGRYLQGAGHEVTLAASVGTALAAAAERRHDLLISDLGLPDGSGCDLMQRLLERGAIKGIAMSGFGMEADIRQSAAAGFGQHLVKPVDLFAIERAIARVLES